LQVKNKRLNLDAQRASCAKYHEYESDIRTLNLNPKPYTPNDKS